MPQAKREPAIPAERVMMTVEEVAERWGVHPRTIYADITRGRIKVLRVGRLVRISRSHVLYLEEAGARNGAV